MPICRVSPLALGHTHTSDIRLVLMLHHKAGDLCTLLVMGISRTEGV